MIQILVLSHSPNLGGGELALKSLIDSTRNTYQWTIVFPASTPPDPAVLPKDASIVLLPELQWWCHEAHEAPRQINRRVFLKSYAELRSLAGRADILLTNTITIPWLGFIAQELGKPHVWYIHEFGDIDHNLKFVAGYDETLRTISACSSRILTISESVKSHIARIIPSDKIDLIHQSIDLAELLTIPPSVEDLSNEISALCMGAIKPSKGQRVALEALANLPGVTLDIVGPPADMDYVQQLEKMAKQTNNVRVESRRYSPAQELTRHNLVLMCSENEGLGRVTLEALAAGRPVIGYACRSTAELLADGRGITYSPNSPEALRERVVQLRTHTNPINTQSARDYVIQTFSDSTQSEDFVSCASSAALSPLEDRSTSGEAYLSLITQKQLWLTRSSELKRTIKSLAPKPVKRVVKRLIGRR